MAIVEVRAPMVSTVYEIRVSEGQVVSTDDELLILESMKMEVPVSSPCNGTVISIEVSLGAGVLENDLLLRLEA